MDFKIHLTSIIFYIFACNVKFSSLPSVLSQVAEDVKAIREKRLPVFVAWSRNDKMIEEKLSRDFLNTLGMHQDAKKKQDQGITEIKWSFFVNLMY